MTRAKPVRTVAARKADKPEVEKPSVSVHERIAKHRVAVAASPGHDELLAEIRELRAQIQDLARPSTHAERGLETGVDSIRRLLSELIESRLETVVTELAAMRMSLARERNPGLPAILERLDRMLLDLGALRFEAEILEHVDPLIHAVVEERRLPDMPEGVVVETLIPGYRTGRGSVVAEAGVAVNRRA